jgi:hypothetical protein
MATKSKKNPKMEPITPSVPPDAYVRLRTMLDSLEFGAIRYYLMGSGASGKEHRYIELDKRLMPLVKWLWEGGAKPDRPDVECPAGYIDCYGCCVPYPCPDPGSGPKPKPKPRKKY